MTQMLVLVDSIRGGLSAQLGQRCRQPFGDVQAHPQYNMHL